MLLSLIAYTAIWGWQYATGFLLLLFCHEMGHFLAARERGLNVGAPIFIPFVGAWIELKELPHNVEMEAYIALAGPFVGTLASLGTYFAARHFDSNLLLAISYSGFFLNLLNLLPVSPLDGGRITAVLTPRVWLLGAPLMLILFLYRPSPFFILIAVLSAPQLIKAWKYDPSAPENIDYYDVSNALRLEYTVLYLLLAGFLAIIAFDTHEMLSGKLSQ